MTEHDTALLFFRHQPDQSATNVAILSSMQSLETSFFLIALYRYPHALSICASAIEGAIKASSTIGVAGSGLDAVIKAARKSSETIDRFPQQSLDDLRRARNRIIHFGFDAEDNSESTSLLLEVGIPFLSLCYHCPVCDDVNAAVCEIGENELHAYKIVPKRMACTGCGFVVHNSEHFLSEVLLEKQVADPREEILKEYV